MSRAKRSNEAWLADLRSGGAAQPAALEDLGAALAAGLPYALDNWLAWDDPKMAALVEDSVQETLLRVMDRLDTFEGRSQFTTWAQKISVRIALTELRRRRWQDVSLDSMLVGEEGELTPQFLADRAPGPAQLAEQGDILAYVQRLIAEELTPKQRQALTAVAISGMPMEEVAQRLGTERNALYKLLHDARVKLRRSLERDGLSAHELLAVFQAE